MAYAFNEDKSKVEIKEIKSYKIKLNQTASIPANTVTEVFFPIGNSVSYSSLMGITEISISTTANNFSILDWYLASGGYIVRVRNNSTSQINLTTESYVRFIYK